MEIQIAKMTLNDLDSIESILEKDFDDFWNYSIFNQELLNKNSYYLVAKLNGEVVGFAGYMLILDEADITNIVVRKDMRNKKIGNKLLLSLINSIDTEVKAITLEVSEGNIPAIHLYESFGFNKVGLRKNYYKNHTNALIMTKFLKN